MWTPGSGGGRGAGGSGDVVGPASSTDNAVARYDGATGELLQDSAVFVTDGASPIVQLGGATSAFPALKRSGATIQARLADDSGPTHLTHTWPALARTTDFSPSVDQVGLCFHNNGAADTVVATLPAATVGLWYRFVVHVAEILQLQSDGTDVIYLGASASLAGGTLTSNTVGSDVLISCSKAGVWTTLSSGTWVAA
jgi:hypothetical protein